MSTLVVSNISDGTTTVGASYVTNGSAKVWVNFNGLSATPVIKDSLNASSITDHSSGNQSVNWSSGFDVANNYVVLVGPTRYNPGNNNWTLHEDYNTARTATSVRLWTNQLGSSFDHDFMQMAILGDLA